MSPAPRLFLDANAQVPVLDVAKDALVAALSVPGNPSSPHDRGRAARRLVDRAREQVAQATGFAPRGLFFTSGASEANRWLADAIAADEGAPWTVVCSPLEHPSLHKPLQAHADAGRIQLHWMAVEDERLVFDPAGLGAARAVLCTAAHNETGLLPDLDALARLLPDDAVFATDVSQALARLGPVPARADAFAASAHKVGGLSGCGALGVRGRAEALAPPWTGGGQEKGVRPGTEAKELIAAFGAACAVIGETRAAHAGLAPARDALEQEICAAFPTARVLGARGPRLPQTSAICFAGADGEAMRMALDLGGLDVGFGSACSALAVEPSRSLMALGLSPQEARATVRLSLAPPFTLDDAAGAARRFIDIMRPVLGSH